MSQITFPACLDSEKIVLGSLFLDNTHLYLIADFLAADDFYSATHQAIFEHMSLRIPAGESVDFVSINHLPESRLEAMGGIGYVSGLIDELGTLPAPESFLLHHAKTIKRYSKLRKLVKAGYDLTQKAQDVEADPDSLAAAAEVLIASASENRADQVKSAYQIGMEQDDIYERQQKGEARRVGIPTGLADIDELTGGLKRQDLIILGGRPGLGKTAFICNLLDSAGDQFKIGFFSLEQGRGEIYNRIVSKRTQINGFSLDIGAVAKDRWSDVFRASNRIKQSTFWIDDTGGNSLSRIRAVSKRLKISSGLDLVVVDYLQLVKHQPPRNVRYERREVVAEISHEFKKLSKDLDVAVLCLAHLNREVGEWEKPELRHLRECGDLEQDADTVIFLWKKLLKPKESGAKAIEAHMISIAKQRNGPTGDRRVSYQPEYTAFYNYAEDWEARL